MSLEAEKHYIHFLQLQNFIENSDERVLSKVKVGQLYQRSILTLKKAIKRYQEIEQLASKVASKYTQFNISILSDLFNSEFTNKQDDYFATGNLLYSALTKQQKLNMNQLCLTYKLIQDKYEYTTYLVKAYINDDTEVLQMIQLEQQEKLVQIEQQIKEIQEQKIETKTEQIEQDDNKQIQQLQEIYDSLHAIQLFNDKFIINTQVGFNLPCALYQTANMSKEQLQMYLNAEKQLKNINKNYKNWQQLVRDNIQTQQAQQLKLLLATYKVKLYWLSHIFHQIKRIKYVLNSIETVLKQTLQFEVVTFTTMNVKLQSLHNKLNEQEQFVVFCWFLYQLENVLQNPLKAQILIDNVQYNSQINVYTTVNIQEKGGIRQEQQIDQAMLYQYKKEIAGIFYNRMCQFITNKIYNVDIHKMLQYSAFAVNNKQEYKQIDLQVIIPPTMPKPIFFDAVVDEILFDDCFVE